MTTDPKPSRRRRTKPPASTNSDDQPTSDPTRANARRAQRDIIGNSPNGEQYDALLLCGWSAIAIERFARLVFGEQISVSTFTRRRRWLAAHGKQVEPVRLMDDVDPDSLLDLVAMRQDLILFQVRRLRLGWQQESKEQRVSGVVTHDVREMNRLIDALRGDYEQLGILPTRDDVDAPPPPATQPDQERPRPSSFGDLVQLNADEQRRLANAVAGFIPAIPGRTTAAYVLERVPDLEDEGREAG